MITGQVEQASSVLLDPPSGSGLLQFLSWLNNRIYPDLALLQGEDTQGSAVTF